MAYRIAGLPRGAFAQYYGKTAEELGRMGAKRVFADADRGFPCRVSLDDAKEGEGLILLNFISHDVTNPCRSAYAIYIRENAEQAPAFVDCLPPVFAERPLSLRGFDAEGMLHAASLAEPEQADDAIRALLAIPEVACIHAHNAAYGCFAARIERHGDGL
ncbi:MULTISPECIES: DUF1203 domain-containing protein [unclassified Novosphingobium]|uniref:DUF1203 domain-containing protein n=1 Tax=unclassified Novosphingobium TaxID=2644732 RepID=UPI00135BF7D1|nr:MULTISPECIES: DUF1203 domain-containing protein [unclassified Novosphingobium]